jgi:hypothetical protein
VNWKDIFCEIDNQLVIIALCTIALICIFYYKGDPSNIICTIVGALGGFLAKGVKDVGKP